jgi:hypothetical protein
MAVCLAMLYARRSRPTARCLAALSLVRASLCLLLSAVGNQISNKMQHWTCTECTVEIKQCDANQIRTGGTVKAPIYNRGRELAKKQHSQQCASTKTGPLRGVENVDEMFCLV